MCRPKKWFIGSASVSGSRSGCSPRSVSLVLIFEHVVGELVVGAELRARDRVERRKIVLGRRLLALEMRIAEQVAEPVGIAIVAAEDRLQRIALEATPRRCP